MFSIEDHQSNVFYCRLNNSEYEFCFTKIHSEAILFSLIVILNLLS